MNAKHACDWKCRCWVARQTRYRVKYRIDDDTLSLLLLFAGVVPHRTRKGREGQLLVVLQK